MNKTVVLISSILFSVFLFSSCSSVSSTRDGNKAFDLEQYAYSAELLAEEFVKAKDEKKKAAIAFKTGQCYRFVNKPEEAIKWYLEAMDNEYGPEASYYYALMLKQDEQYDRAIDQFKEYIKDSPENKAKADHQIKGCGFAKSWLRMKSKYDIFTVGRINTAYIDYGPTLYENKSLVFSSSRDEASGNQIFARTGEKFYDLFFASRSGEDSYNSPIPFGEGVFNKADYSEGTITFNSNYDEAFFTRCINKDEEVTMTCQIFRSEKDDQGVWQDPTLVELFGDSIDVGHPCLIDDSRRLLFSSNAPGGHGGKDLYYSERIPGGDSWGLPVNLGTTINTDGHEMFPFVHTDGALYFASDGHVGMGGLDMFMADRAGNSWSDIRNLQPPVNSGADDFGLIFDESEVLNVSGYYEASGFFASSRSGGKGADDIYKFILRKPAYFELEILVLERIRENPKDPNSPVLEYRPLNEARVGLSMVGDDGLPMELKSAMTTEDGRTYFSIEPETDYSILASKPEYITKSEKFSTKQLIASRKMAIKLTLETILERIVEDAPINVPNIYYNFDRWDIRSDAAKVLDQVVELLRINPDIQAELGSHTDSRGSFVYNERLSQRRADAVVRYLVSRGIDRRRLTARGYGESTLAVKRCGDGSDCTEREHQKNRRTTFTIRSSKGVYESTEPENITTDPNMLKREREGTIKKEEPDSD